MADEDVAAILHINSVITCRGGNSWHMANQAVAVHQPQGQNQFEQMMQMMMTMLPRLTAQPHCSEPEINILQPGAGRAPQGRPMRSLSFGGTSRIADSPPPSVHGSPVPLQDAPSPPAKMTTDAGGDVAAEGVVQVVETPKKVLHDSMEDVRAKMLSRASKHDEVPEMEVAKPETVLMKRPASVAKPETVLRKRPASAVTGASKKAAVEAGDIWKHKPSIGFERTRNQVMCRNGKCGPGSCYAIPYYGNGGEKGAWKKAEVWLKTALNDYKKAGHKI